MTMIAPRSPLIWHIASIETDLTHSGFRTLVAKSNLCPPLLSFLESDLESWPATGWEGLITQCHFVSMVRESLVGWIRSFGSLLGNLILGACRFSQSCYFGTSVRSCCWCFWSDCLALGNLSWALSWSTTWSSRFLVSKGCVSSCIVTHFDLQSGEATTT